MKLGAGGSFSNPRVCRFHVGRGGERYAGVILLVLSLCPLGFPRWRTLAEGVAQLITDGFIKLKEGEEVDVFSTRAADNVKLLLHHTRGRKRLPPKKIENDKELMEILDAMVLPPDPRAPIASICLDDINFSSRSEDDTSSNGVSVGSSPPRPIDFGAVGASSDDGETPRGSPGPPDPAVPADPSPPTDSKKHEDILVDLEGFDEEEAVDEECFMVPVARTQAVDPKPKDTTIALGPPELYLAAEVESVGSSQHSRSLSKSAQRAPARPAKKGAPKSQTLLNRALRGKKEKSCKESNGTPIGVRKKPARAPQKTKNPPPKKKRRTQQMRLAMGSRICYQG